MTARKPTTKANSTSVTTDVRDDGRFQALIHLSFAAKANAEALSAIASAIGGAPPMVVVNQAKD